jgi:hypothetical protein
LEPVGILTYNSFLENEVLLVKNLI